MSLTGTRSGTTATPPKVRLVLTGGQSGVDRAATDFALSHGIAYGGWVPAGGWAEDFPTAPGVLASYPRFTATATADPAVRTVRNVEDADALLVLVLTEDPSGGTELAVERAEHLVMPHVSIRLGRPDSSARLQSFAATLGRGLTLNVAGPRESEQPGLYAATRAFLDAHVALLFE